MPFMDSKTVKPSATLSTFISKEPSICVRRGQSSRTRDKEDLQPDDLGTPSHKYATCACSDQRQFWLPQSNSKNVNSQTRRSFRLRYTK